MKQLSCLPQDAIFWGHGILPTAVASPDQHGIRRPLTGGNAGNKLETLPESQWQ